MGGGAEDFASSFNDAGVRAIHQRDWRHTGSDENETKWVALRPNPQEYSFYLADRMVDWAQSNNMLMRGHTLLWQKTQYFPKWLVNYDFGTRPATEAERLLREHISTVCTHFGSRIFTYDVVNEAVNEFTGEIRQTPFTKYLGDNAIDICFDRRPQRPRRTPNLSIMTIWAGGRAAPNTAMACWKSSWRGSRPTRCRWMCWGCKAISVPAPIPGRSQGPNTSSNAADQAAWKAVLGCGGGDGACGCA